MGGFRNNQNDFNYSPQEVGYGSGGYGSTGAPVIAPTFISTPSNPAPYAYAPPIAPIAPVAPVYGGGFGGGFGFGGGLAEAVVLGSIFGDGFGRGRGNDHQHIPFPRPCKDDNDNPLAILAAISSVKDSVSNEGRGLLAAVANSKDTTVAEARAISNAVCEAEKTNLQQFYAAAIQASNNTQSIKDQATAQHAAILAAVNNSDVLRLRDELDRERRGRDRDGLEVRIENNNTAVAQQLQAQQQFQLQRDLEETRRRFDSREIEINNINTNTNVQAQLQAQAQAQVVRELDEHKRRWDARENEINIVNTNTNINAQAQAQAQAQNLRDLDRDHRWNARFDALLSQSNKTAQDIINIGSGIVGASQTASPTNVNSKNNQ